MFDDGDLYGRGIQTALACWAEIARGTTGATMVRAPGMTAAVFSSGPERQVYNNAVLDRDLGATGCQRAIEAMEAAYAEANVADFAAWVHESEAVSRAALLDRGYSISETTRAMGMPRSELQVEQRAIERGSPDWAEYLRILDVPEILLGVDPDAFPIVIARLDGEGAAAGMAFDHDGDCGMFNITTLESSRRRGIGTAVIAALLADARSRGCTTASLQSTEMAEGVYASVGFRDLGRIIEFARRRSAIAPDESRRDRLRARRALRAVGALEVGHG
jgi:GNAT superfamily N-acetyltransferase